MPHATRLRFLCALSLLALAGCATHPGSPVPGMESIPAAKTTLMPEGAKDVSATLEPIATRAKIPGMVALVLRGDQIIAYGATGVRKAGSTERITLGDRFLLCSATKAMTATLAALAVDEGKLSWSTTLGDVFPDDDGRLHPEWKPVTLAQLLQHRAGAPSVGDSLWTSLRVHFSGASAADKSRAMVRKILARKPSFPPGSRYAYADTDYLIVGAMLEKITSRPWEQLIQEKLWQPLGIAHGGFGAPGTPGEIDQPWGHWGMVLTGRPVAPGGFFARINPPRFYGPAATAQLTISDWAKFISLHLRGDPANPQHAARLLKAESFAALHRPAKDKVYESGWILSTEPWARGPRPGDRGCVITSEGDNGFWRADAWVAPEIDLAVLVIVNQGDPAGRNPLTQGVREVLRSLVREFVASPAK
jgi:CubicO group peptidase (beta-lactamase class C family)